MSEMVRRFLRQKFGSVGTVIALSLLALATALEVAATGNPAFLESGFLAILLLSAGSVSRDVSSGALQIILARPIRRVDYLFGRYLGILAAYAIYIAATALAAIGIIAATRALLGARGGDSLAAGALALGVAASLLSAALFAAILVFFSTFLPGYADVLSYILLTALLAVPDVLAARFSKPILAKIGTALRENLLPHVAWRDVLRGEDVLGAATGRYVLALVGYLALAAVVFSRREFSYGQD